MVELNHPRMVHHSSVTGDAVNAAVYGRDSTDQMQYFNVIQTLKHVGDYQTNYSWKTCTLSRSTFTYHLLLNASKNVVTQIIV